MHRLEHLVRSSSIPPPADRTSREPDVVGVLDAAGEQWSVEQAAAIAAAEAIAMAAAADVAAEAAATAQAAVDVAAAAAIRAARRAQDVAAAACAAAGDAPATATVASRVEEVAAAAALAVVEAACLVGRQLAADTAATAEAVVTATVPSAGTAACDEATIQLLQAQGASLHTIAARLNADTSRTVTGARWTHRSVATVLAGGPPPAKARVRRRAPAAPRPRAPQTGRPVFVVDADPACRELIRTSLSALGLGNPCVEFSDGASVVRAMQQCLDVDGAELPALVLLDADLAGTSGADVLEWMAARTGLGATPPVIMLSARASAGDVNRAYRLGARSYLVKPVGFSAIGSVARDLGLAWMLV